MRYDEPDFPSQPKTTRNFFSDKGCHIHGHPSTGGILIKHSADLVDLQYLSLPRLTSTLRSTDPKDEDTFCELLRRVGASWWIDEASFLRAFHGQDRYDEGQYHPHEAPAPMENEAMNEKRARRSLTFGWPADGVGVWVTKATTYFVWPQGHSRKLDFALDMEERIGVMREFGAEFVEDVGLVRELNEPWSEDVYLYYPEEEEDDGSSEEEDYSEWRCIR